MIHRGYLFYGFISIYLLKERNGFEIKSNIFCLGLAKFSNIFKNIKSQTKLFIFLGAYFIYSDGYGTISAAAIQFALVELEMKITEIMIGMIFFTYLCYYGM